MLDPQPTLQAWRDAVDEDGYDEVLIDGIIAAGDALAVLVPQLLDQLAVANQRADAAAIVVGGVRQALAEKQRQCDGWIQSCLEGGDIGRALGERCHQLETLIREVSEHGIYHYRWDETNDRAAEPPWWERAAAALGDTPPPDPFPERGDAAVSPEPGQSLMEIEYAERFAAVEPPQPETPSERDK